MPLPRTPPSLSEVLRESNTEFVNALSDEKYATFAQRANDHYWHWDKIRIIARQAGLDPKIAWVVIKMGRNSLYRTVNLSGFNSEPIKFALTNPLQRDLMLIDQQLAGIVTSPFDELIPQDQRERYIIKSLTEEAIASSMLEGAATTHRQAKEMLQQNRRPRSHGEQMVFNNYRTIRFIREHRNTDLSLDFILEIHNLLTEHTLDEEKVGRLRRDSDQITVVNKYEEIIHNPPQASQLTQRISQLCKFANQTESQNDFIHPIIKACILHYQFAFDHPFCDGNGRTARALFYWFVLRRKYWLFEFMPISRLIYRSPGKYSKAYLYTETDDFDVTYFLYYHLRIISRARRELIEYITRKQHEVEIYRELFVSIPHLNNRQSEFLQQLLQKKQSVVTIQQYQQQFVVAYGTARSDLLKLTENGYLMMDQVGKRYEFKRGPKFHEITPKSQGK